MIGASWHERIISCFPAGLNPVPLNIHDEWYLFFVLICDILLSYNHAQPPPSDDTTQQQFVCAISVQTDDVQVFKEIIYFKS